MAVHLALTLVIKPLLFNNIKGIDQNNKKFIRGNMDSTTSKSYRGV